jgi:hypothetical protein
MNPALPVKRREPAGTHDRDAYARISQRGSRGKSPRGGIHGPVTFGCKFLNLRRLFFDYSNGKPCDIPVPPDRADLRPGVLYKVNNGRKGKISF